MLFKDGSIDTASETTDTDTTKPPVFGRKELQAAQEKNQNQRQRLLKNRKPITFLRMDVEGYETEVIDVMQETFKSPHFKKLFVEIHPQ